MALSANQNQSLKTHLRTLELFIDNLQQEFLQGKIVPVRAQLMRALWDIINRDDIIRKAKDEEKKKEQSAVAAFRILGKFGGENRSTIREPAILKWKKFEEPGVTVKIVIDSNSKITTPLDGFIEITFETLKKKNISSETQKFAANALLHCFYAIILRDDEEHLLEDRINCDFQKFNIDETLIKQYSKQLLDNHGIEHGKGNGYSPNYHFGIIISGLLFTTNSFDCSNGTGKEIMDALGWFSIFQPVTLVILQLNIVQFKYINLTFALF